MPLVTISQALYDPSTISFASDISVLCRISGVSAPVPILTKAGQNLLLTSIHIGDDERGFNSSTIADASLSKHTFGAGATVIGGGGGGGGDDFNPNVGTLTYWGGLAAESKLLVYGKSSHPMNPQQSTSGLRTGDLVLLLHVAQRVWMNKTTLQVREGLSKIYVLSRQEERMRQRVGRERRIQIGSERDDNDEVHLTIDQRKELRSLLSPADARFLLDDVAGNQRIQRLFALARREEPINTTAALLQQSLHSGKGGRGGGGGGGSLAYVGMSTQLDGGFSEDPNPFVRRSREGGAEESQILPFDIDSSGATRAMSLQQSAPVRLTYAKTPTAPINFASTSSPLITSCGKVPLATGIMFNISCSIRSFLRSALPVQSTGILPAAPASGSVGVVSAASRGQPLHQHSLVELGRASLVLPQSRSQPLVLIIAYSTGPHSRLIDGVNVSAPTPTLAEHLCDLFFKSFSGREKVIISNCLQRDGFIYVSSLSDVMSDSYDEDEEAFNMALAHEASQLLAKQQKQLEESNSRKRPRDVSPRGSGAVNAVAPSVNNDPDTVGIDRNLSRLIQGLFLVTSIYLPALQLGVQVGVQGRGRRMTGQDIESQFTDLSSLPIDVDNTNDETLGRLALCKLLTLDSLSSKIAYLTTFLSGKRRKEESSSSALSNDCESVYTPIWLKVVKENEDVSGVGPPLELKPVQRGEEGGGGGGNEEGFARPLSGWIEFKQTFVQSLLAGLPASSIAANFSNGVDNVDDDTKVGVVEGVDSTMLKRRRIIISSTYELLVSLLHKGSRILLSIEVSDENKEKNRDKTDGEIILGKLNSFSL